MNINSISLKKLIKYCQNKIIAYHGSPEKNLTTLRGSNPYYDGSLGLGIYCSFEESIARNYARRGSLYTVEILLSENEILWISQEGDNIDFFENEMSSMLVGESLQPFIIYLDGKSGREAFFICDEYNFNSIVTNEILNYIENNYSEIIFEKTGLQIEDVFINNGNRININYNEIDEINEYLDEIINKTRNLIEEKYNPNNRYELEEISNLARQHGYKAVSFEGFRNTLDPWHEIVVFDDKDLKIINEQEV